MSELIKRAKAFATQAHQRIGHRRKYTKQPYEVHLKAVAEIVSTVSEDEEMIAAAWLHDTVEDTSATHHDIEKAFGAGVRSLVYDLTDISKPSDGNRMARKAIDREHIAAASVRAKTVKLADLIDNSRDICKHDPGFARVYLGEMSALLEVLGEGDETLFKAAQKELLRCSEKLGLVQPPGSMQALEETLPLQAVGFSQRRVQRLFTEAFTAKDIAEPLHSFDADRPAVEVKNAMQALGISVAGIRGQGMVAGFAWKDDLAAGNCGECARRFGRDQVVYGDAYLSDVILVLTRHNHCFISVLDSVVGVVTRSDIEKPIVRMWLFGMITMVEMSLATTIRSKWPDDSWREHCPPGRLKKAEELCAERSRREQQCELIDCLQLSDKGRILLRDPQTIIEFSFKSKGEAEQAIRDLESLRNNLAHGQGIITYDWPQIVRMTQQIELIVAEM
jgi:CBS domain-containing protein